MIRMARMEMMPMMARRKIKMTATRIPVPVVSQRSLLPRGPQTTIPVLVLYAAL